MQNKIHYFGIGRFRLEWYMLPFTGSIYRISFRSKNELCLFRFFIEYWHEGEVYHARSLYSIGPTKRTLRKYGMS